MHNRPIHCENYEDVIGYYKIAVHPSPHTLFNHSLVNDTWLVYVKAQCFEENSLRVYPRCLVFDLKNGN